MKHRYGRHGTKAWLRWRNRHFRRTHLTFSPQIAILNVPLEFRSQIRKVTIIMADGTQWVAENNIQQTTEALNSPTVDADKGEDHLLEQPPTPKKKYLHEAREIAKDMARDAFENMV